MQLIHRPIVWFAAFLGAIWTVLFALITLPYVYFRPRFGTWVVRNWSRGWCALMGVKVHASGVENLHKYPAVVLAPNHASMYDIFVVATLPIDFWWIMKKQVAQIPFMGWTIKAMRNYLVSRDRSGKDVAVMGQVEQGLRDGQSVIIFPEGTRTRTGELLPFKKGAFRTAQNAGVPLIPIGLSGTREIAPPGKLPVRWGGHHVRVNIGEPFVVSPEMPIQEAMAAFREKAGSPHRGMKTA